MDVRGLGVDARGYKVDVRGRARPWPPPAPSALKRRLHRTVRPFCTWRRRDAVELILLRAY
eukprot:8901840-Pyramimonas_sp.AAC.2